MRTTLVRAGIVLACACDGGGAELHVRTLSAEAIVIAPRRSLAVTEPAILERFGFARVMIQLAAQSGVPGLTARDLFQQWWDTQNPGPGLGRGAHCDDVVGDDGLPRLNDFPYTCRPAPGEGALAGVDPFVATATNPEAYLPIGLFNRFDLAPGDGSHCGEYRIVYARRAGIDNTRQRNLIIFEAALPNPHPQQGLKGCRKIVERWASLSRMDDVEDRADALEGFYFDGLPGHAPVIHVDHLGGGPAGAGQVRTNQFVQEGVTDAAWSLREFKLVRSCAGGACSAMRFVPVTVKLNPFGPLFAPGDAHPRAPAFRAAFVSQTASLAALTLTDLDAEIDDQYNGGQSQASGSTENAYVTQLGLAPQPLSVTLDAELARLAIPLTASDIVARAEALSCAGCHRLSNGKSLGGGLVWPASLGFTHVTEREMEVVAGVSCFRLSPALTSTFLPKRKQVMEDFLAEKLKPPKKPKDPIGGRRTH